MRAFGVYATRAISSSGTICAVASATTVLPKVHDILLSCSDTPSDTNIQMRVGRSTSINGTSAAYVPIPLDPGAPAAIAQGRDTYSGNPTYQSAVLTFSFNVQVTFRWVVPPEEGIVVPASASNGVGIDCTGRSAGTVNIQAQCVFSE